MTRHMPHHMPEAATRCHLMLMCHATQVLLGSDGRGGDPLALDRVQVAALVATAAKFGAACETVERYRELDVMEEAKVAWLALYVTEAADVGTGSCDRMPWRL